jgi:alkaline phosphatase
VILGGGEDYWFPPGTPGGHPDNPPTDPTEQSNGDRANLVERAQRLGYHYVSTREGLRRARGRKLLGLFANEEMFEHREEGEGDLYEPLVPLPEMATKALDVLSRDRDGLFVVIEEEAIDEMAPENNAGLMGRQDESGEELSREDGPFTVKGPTSRCSPTGPRASTPAPTRRSRPPARGRSASTA